MASEKVTFVPCGKSGEGRVAGTIGIILGYTITGILIGSILTIFLMISYIFPGLNILVKFLIGLRNNLGFGFWKGILSFVALCSGFGFLIGLGSSYRSFSQRILNKRLSAANLRKVECGSCSVCHGCEHRDVIILDKSDPDNSKREFYCKYFPFKFEGAESGADFFDITCCHYETEELFQELIDVIKSQSSEYK